MTGTTGARIFAPWLEKLSAKGARFLGGHFVRDVKLDQGGSAVAVTAEARGQGRKVSRGCGWCFCLHGGDGRAT